jgi:hypothetical protein
MDSGSVLPRFVIPTVRIRMSAIRDILIRGALPVLAGALVLTGCGSGGSSSSNAAAAGATAGATASAGLSAFQTCLKQHGVKVAPGQGRLGARPTGSFSPGTRPTGTRPTGVRPTGSFGGQNSAAFQACAKYAPAGFGGAGRGAISSSALAAFKSCLSSNGVKVTGTTASAIMSELRNATGKTATAVRTCQVLLRPAAPTSTPSA